VSLDEYYKRLELTGTATPADVKRAYRRLRAKYHPDRNKGREASVEPVFKRIQEAFEILIGERKAPLSVGASPVRTPTPTSTPKSAPDWTWTWAQTSDETRRQTETEPPSRNYRSGPPLRGANCLTELFVPLEAAIHGGAVDVSYMVQGVCDQCRGHARSRCPLCFGKGVVSYRKCETVRVEPGAWDGQRMVVEGAGHPGTNGGAAGDAIFSIVVVCSSAFRRDALHVACDIEVDFVTAMLGGSYQAQVLGCALPVTIEPNSGPGTTIRLRGQGLSDRNGTRGDLTLRVVLAMPAAAAHLTEQEREGLRELFAAVERRTAPR